MPTVYMFELQPSQQYSHDKCMADHFGIGCQLLIALYVWTADNAK